MNKLFTDNAWKDYIYWFETDKKQLKKIVEAEEIVFVTHSYVEMEDNTLILKEKKK